MKAGTRLQRLHAGLGAIPQKRQNTNLLGTLAQYGSNASTSEAVLTVTADAERFAVQVFPDLATAPVAESRRRASRLAGKLAKRLRERIDAVQDRATDEDFAQLGVQARSADKTLGERWSRQLEDRLKGYGALVQAAKAAKLSESWGLATQLTILQGHAGAPPRTPGQAERIREALDGLTGMVAQLGLEGAPGRFLMDAAAGRGDARALRDPEVQAFVERHDLWRLLVVTFR
jgi:hypothetical protein